MLETAARIYRLVASAMLGAWGFEYVGASWRMAWFATLGVLGIVAGTLGKTRERTWIGAAYAALALLLFWLPLGFGATWGNLVAILLIPASLRASAWISGKPALPADFRNALVLAAMATLWLWVTRWTTLHFGAGQLTTSWALLALLIFGAGLGLRERLYRFGGFAVLALAVGRLFLVDVWRFDTLPRIVSFLALGVVLLALSFVYNRFAETMRRWL